MKEPLERVQNVLFLTTPHFYLRGIVKDSILFKTGLSVLHLISLEKRQVLLNLFTHKIQQKNYLKENTGS